MIKEVEEEVEGMMASGCPFYEYMLHPLAFRLMKLAIYDDDTEGIEEYLQDNRLDPSWDGNISVCHAVRSGHTRMLNLLLLDGRVDPSTRYNYPIRLAKRRDHTNMIAILLRDERVWHTATAEGAEGYYRAIG